MVHWRASGDGQASSIGTAIFGMELLGERSLAEIPRTALSGLLCSSPPADMAALRSPPAPATLSTRVFVKNLPKYLKEDRLRKHFEEKGTITDCKILKTPYGESRRIGYIGYTTSEEAEEAVRYYNRTFIDTSRISVELSKPQDDSTLPRPWSAYSKGSSKYNKRHGIKPEPKKTQKGGEAKDNVVRSLYEEVLLKHKDDPRFAEFLQVMAPRARNKAWANDDL
ncbi:Multiple RNA-binding domain-containing protein 1, partial [Spiromyces aspiralis]